MLDLCGLSCEYGDALKMPADLVLLFEEMHITHCGKEGKHMAATVAWPLLWAVWLATNTQLEAEARVRKLEDELKLEKDIRVFTT